ncbi:MAG TPA: inositol 2-dehydrogenase [Vicinamibacterales bacterium]|nr:inositol 2-dehydrogenase [Vicinamibacterales bacterium]
MTSTGKGRLAIGLIGAGRLGRVYARDLASRIAETKLVAIADPVEAVAQEVAAEFDVPKHYADPLALIDDPAVDAVVIVSPTHTHRELVIAAASRKKPTFCEKPPALSLEEVAEMQDAVAKSAMFLQMGFMRRFDAGYASAKRQIEEGRIGVPLVFKSTSRDPFRPSLEYANPKSSGGMLLDMGIHDFDLARWFMGEVRTVSTIGATIAYPELATVGDIDNAVASLTFASGKLGVVDLSRSGIYGYDISTEILGLEGTLRIGYLRETPVMLMTKNSVAHDTVPYFMERFRDAYTTQLQNFAQNVQQDRPAPITIEDGMEALRIGVAATRAHETGRSVVVTAIKA